MATPPINISFTADGDSIFNTMSLAQEQMSYVSRSISDLTVQVNEMAVRMTDMTNDMTNELTSSMVMSEQQRVAVLETRLRNSLENTDQGWWIPPHDYEELRSLLMTLSAHGSRYADTLKGAKGKPKNPPKHPYDGEIHHEDGLWWQRGMAGKKWAWVSIEPTESQREQAAVTEAAEAAEVMEGMAKHLGVGLDLALGPAWTCAVRLDFPKQCFRVVVAPQHSTQRGRWMMIDCNELNDHCHSVEEFKTWVAKQARMLQDLFPEIPAARAAKTAPDGWYEAAPGGVAGTRLVQTPGMEKSGLLEQMDAQISEEAAIKSIQAIAHRDRRLRGDS